MSPKEELYSVKLLNQNDCLSLNQQVQLKLFEKAIEENEPTREEL